jgi:hypothetical protein
MKGRTSEPNCCYAMISGCTLENEHCNEECFSGRNGESYNDSKTVKLKKNKNVSLREICEKQYANNK